MQNWTATAQKAASAKGLTQPAFLNMMGQYLTALAQPEPEDEPRQSLLEQHLSSRLRQGFDMPEIISEIALIGQCVARLWANSKAHERPDPVQIHEFYGRLQRDAALVSSVFTRHMLEDEQREKRLRRKIRVLAEEALQPGSPPLVERFSELLELVMQALDAQSASLLLNHGEDGDLRLIASVGRGEEQIRALVTARHFPRPSPHDQVSPEPDYEIVKSVELTDDLRESGIESILSAILGTSERASGMLLVGSAEKRAYSHRERRRLEALAEQLTFHLESARLFADLAITINDLKRERELRELFVAVLAHDLRGPLAAAQAASRMLAMEGLLDAKDRAVVEKTVDRSIDRMDRMISDLLDVSRVRAGQRLPVQLAPCSLNDIASEVIAELNVNDPGRFRLVQDDGVCGNWSADNLRRALWNFITNALKYGAKDQTVTVSVERRGDRARLSVHNLGPAIPDEVQAQLFEPFIRSKNPGETKSGGWGLGLPLVRACASAHGGTAGVRSDGSNGTEFYLELPLDSSPFQEPSRGNDTCEA